MGVLLALGLVAHARGRVVGALAAGSIPILLVTLYFTYSRGAWIALVGGAVVLALLDGHRLRLASAAVAVALPTGLALAAAYGSVLTQAGTATEVAIEAGRDLGYVILIATAAAALIGWGLAEAGRRLDPPAWLQRAFAGLLLVAIVGSAVVGLIRAGGPIGLPDRIRTSFTGPTAQVSVGESANQRLFSLSNDGRIIGWRVAQSQFAERRLIGTGAGTYEQHWVADRPVPGKVRDAHSLYLETLAELGVVGMALLGLALAVPLAAACVARRRALVPAATAAYVAYLAHAAIDWDWELPAVTLAALFCGGAVVIAARRDVPALSNRARTAGAAAALVVSAFAAVGLLGSTALDDGWDALEQGDTATASEKADLARRWAPWSSEPFRLAASAASLAENDAGARSYLLRAVEKEPSNWNLWFDLAQLQTGARAQHSLGRALGLNPKSLDIAEYIQANRLRTPQPIDPKGSSS